MPKKYALKDKHNIKASKREMNEETSVNFFENLPDEIVHLIATFLSVEEMTRLSLTNHKIYGTMRSSYCHNLGIWSHGEKKNLRRATLKEVSDDKNYQIAERKKADIQFARVKKSLQRQFALLPENDSCQHVACMLLSAFTIVGLGILGMVSAVHKYALPEEDIVKTLFITIGGATMATMGILASIKGCISLGNYADTVSQELAEHQTNGRQKLYNDIKTDIVPLNVAMTLKR